MIEHLHGHYPRHGPKALKEFFQGVVVLELIEERLHGDARAGEHRCSPENFRIDSDESFEPHTSRACENRANARAQAKVRDDSMTSPDTLQA